MPSTCPYYDRVPKELEANKAYRRKLLEQAEESTAARETLMSMCKEDILFWINCFVWCFEPRNDETKVFPVITWTGKGQDDCIQTIQDNCGHRDTMTLKARDRSGTWNHIFVFAHEFIFTPYFTLGVVSHNEAAADTLGATEYGDLGTMMPKFRFLFGHLPWWMKPDTGKNRHLQISNRKNNALITAFSTTKKTAVGARLTALFVDELAQIANAQAIDGATADVSKSRFFVTTPYGDGAEAAFKLCDNTAITQIRLKWQDDPRKNFGRYQYDREKNQVIHFDDFKGVVKLPPEIENHPERVFNFPDDYPYICDGKERSPAYDEQWIRRKDPRFMAMNWDMDRQGSSYQYFDNCDFHVLKSVCRFPMVTGDFKYNPDGSGAVFEESDDGPVHIYKNLFDGKLLNVQAAVAGADIAGGKGASNSVLAIGDGVLGERVLEYADPFISSTDFARKTIAILRWLDPDENCYLIWDALGMGGADFTQEVIRLGYRNFYYNAHMQKIVPEPSDKPGFYLTADANGNGARAMVFAQFKDAMSKGKYTERSHAVIEEMKNFIYVPGGGVQHSKAHLTKDPTGAKANHGDRVTAAILMWHGMLWRGSLVGNRTEAPEVPTKPAVIPENCAYNRLQKWKQKHRQEEYSCFA